MAWEADWELEDDSAGGWEELEASEAWFAVLPPFLVRLDFWER